MTLVIRNAQYSTSCLNVTDPTSPRRSSPYHSFAAALELQIVQVLVAAPQSEK